MKNLTPVALAAAMACASITAHAQTAPATTSSPDTTLQAVKVTASADASAEGLSPAYAGGQVARGGRAGILGTKDNMETPFSVTAYTNELIQDKQAKSVGDVLQNDPSVRVARGFGNFQESYFIRGYLLGSDDIAYNGLYSLLPRQYIATELFERVEVLRGASTFLTGANPNEGGPGGSINLLPKRAPNEPLTRVTAGIATGGQYTLSTDVARRFGPDQSTGVRVNLAGRSGGTAVDDEKGKLGLAAVGLDWRGDNVRLSADLGWQDNRLDRTRTNVSFDGVTVMPSAPNNKTNWAQPWSYSNERDVFGTVRGEWDINEQVTAWAAAGMRRTKEANQLGNIVVTNGGTGDGYYYRFDNTREDKVSTGEIGARGKFVTGPVKHEVVTAFSQFVLEKKNAYVMDFFNHVPTNLYNPVQTTLPPVSGTAFRGNDLANPWLNGVTRLDSVALGDTLSMLDDTLLLTLGIRHQSFEITDIPYGAETGTTTKNSRNSPAVAVVYKLSRQASLYANYVEALAQGKTAPLTSFNPPGQVVNGGQTLSPYISRQKEIGAKYDAGNFGGTLALFSSSRPRPAGVDPQLYFKNDGKEVNQGVEITTFGKPVRSVSVLGGVTWLDAKQKDTNAGTFDGKRTIGVPEFQANVGAEWNLPYVRNLALDGRVVYTGSVYADAANTLKVPSWTRFDAGVRYIVPVQTPVTLRLRVENLFDKDYWGSSGGYPDNGYLAAGNPRTVSLSASVDF